MESIYFILILGGIAFAVFEIMLMIKLWKMCLHVEMLANKFCKEETQVNENVNVDSEDANKNVKIGDLVVRLGDEKQMKVVNIDGDNIYCQICGTLKTVAYEPYEIELFDKYWANKKK